MSHVENNNLDPGHCMSYRLRRAARVAARHYDQALKPAGLRNTQFTMLSALSMEGPITIGDLAKKLGTDATTLTRNLDVLARRGLVENTTSDDARERRVSLTQDGSACLKTALPLWEAAQKSLLASLENRSWPEMMDGLMAIEKTTSSP